MTFKKKTTSLLCWTSGKQVSALNSMVSSGLLFYSPDQARLSLKKQASGILVLQRIPDLGHLPEEMTTGITFLLPHRDPFGCLRHSLPMKKILILPLSTRALSDGPLGKCSADHECPYEGCSWWWGEALPPDKGHLEYWAPTRGEACHLSSPHCYLAQISRPKTHYSICEISGT